MNVLGLDIGGANIKASDADGNTRCIAFPMWTHSNSLAAALTQLSADAFDPPDLVGITMTAELADCFASKTEGVTFVINAVESAFPGTPLRIWLTSGEFAEPDDARELPMLVAAANWHALATWAGRAVPDGPAVLIDTGSTTTDIIPLLDGMPVAEGLSDPERLLSGELVYTGAYRTPLCAVVSSVPFRGTRCSVAAEVFATISDVLVTAGLLPENPARTDTADGRPLTRGNCHRRLARMLCCDACEISGEEIAEIAADIICQQQNQLRTALGRVIDRLDTVMQSDALRTLSCEPPVVLLSGSGCQLARRLLSETTSPGFREVLELPKMFHKPVAEAACAFAVARLAHDRCRDDLLNYYEPDSTAIEPDTV